MHILAFCNHLLVLPQFEFLHEKGFCILLLESVIQHNWCLCYNGILALGAHCSRDVAIPSLRFLAVHEQVYPFLWDETFLKLTEARTERIRANTKYLTDELSSYIKELKHPLRLKILDHGLFFGIFYQGKADHHPEKFLKLSMMHQVPAKYCDSFGFDFLSLTNVVSYHENIQESSLRFCSGDNTEQIEEALKLIKDYLAFFDLRT